MVYKITSVTAVKGTAQPVFQFFHLPVDFQRFVRCMDYMFITFDIVVSGWGNQILDHLLAENILNTVERSQKALRHRQQAAKNGLAEQPYK